MSEDWKPGDLAMCISDNPCPVRGTANPYRKGGSYIVTSYKEGEDDFGRPSAGIKTIHCNSMWWSVTCFRKIRPHTPDAEDAETICLLKGEKVKA